MTIKPHQCLQYIEVLEAVMLQPGPVSGLGLGRKQLEGYNLQMGKTLLPVRVCNVTLFRYFFHFCSWGGGQTPQRLLTGCANEYRNIAESPQFCGSKFGKGREGQLKVLLTSYYVW